MELISFLFNTLNSEPSNLFCRALKGVFLNGLRDFDGLFWS